MKFNLVKKKFNLLIEWLKEIELWSIDRKFRYKIKEIESFIDEF